MAYRDFTLRKVKADFHLELIEDQDVFSHVPETPVSEHPGHFCAYGCVKQNCYFLSFIYLNFYDSLR